MKKIFIALAALCTMMLFIPSCGEPNEPQEPDAKVVTEKSAVVEDAVEIFGQLNLSSEELAVAEFGFYISTSEFQKLNDGLKKTVTTVDDNQKFSTTISGLEPATKYYYRAYLVTNDASVVGETLTFETSDFAGKNTTFTVGNVEFTMIFVNGGTFTMGAADSDTQAWPNEKPAHQVTLSSYYIAETEVTQELWTAIMGTTPSEYSGATNPVEYASWNDCQEFITKLNELYSDLFNQRRFRLPTEAEWEYAARGGDKGTTSYLYSGSDHIWDVAWYSDNSNSEVHPVKQKQANELGIYDMTGNVWELCQNYYYDYTETAETDPQGPAEGTEYAIRGGCYLSDARNSRITNRGAVYPADRTYGNGLRLVLTK